MMFVFMYGGDDKAKVKDRKLSTMIDYIYPVGSNS